MAGVQAPMNAQGPSVAAATAPQIPTQMAQNAAGPQEVMDSAMQSHMNTAMTQIRLHQLQVVAMKLPENQQEAIYNSKRDEFKQWADKGDITEVASGDLKAVQDEFTKRQADAQAAGQGLLPLHILPSPDSSYKEPKYSLFLMGKGKLSEDIPATTWGADELGMDEDTFKKAGLVEMKMPSIQAGTDQKSAFQSRQTAHTNWVAKQGAALASWQKSQANISQSNKKLAQQQQDFEQTESFKKWQTEFNADVKKQVAAENADKAPAQILSTATYAKTGISQMNDAVSIMDVMEKQGVLGKSILNDKAENYLFSKGLADPSWDDNTKRMMGRLRTALGNVAITAMRVHTGRTSKEIYEDYKQKNNIGQSWAALRGSMEQSREMFQGYIDDAANTSIKALREGTAGGGGGTAKKKAYQQDGKWYDLDTKEEIKKK